MEPSPPKLPINPGIIFDQLNAYQKSSALKAAIELDIFSSIAKGNNKPVTLALDVQANPRAIRILCDTMVIMGFLTKQSLEYDVTPISETLLVKSSPAYMGSMTLFMNSDELTSAFQNFTDVVRHGGTRLPEQGTVTSDFDGWVKFAKHMMPMVKDSSLMMAEILAKRKPGTIKVLDIAAGHGMFGIQVALKNPQARIVALDWAKVLDVAMEHAQQHHVADRIQCLEGDAMTIDFETRYDAVLLTNFLHHFSAEVNIKLMQKITACLNPGGVVLTLEFVPNEDRVSPLSSAGFALTMLGTTPHGDAYTFAEYEAMWAAAGSFKQELMDVPNTPQRLIISTLN
jgi:ubiquinone/menaquinone biosynthesis C-methylase UbiE